MSRLTRGARILRLIRLLKSGFRVPQIRRPLSSIPILRPKLSGETVTIGRSSAQCTHPIPQQWLNLHISRVHVVVRYVPQTRELAVFCKGLNPIYVDTSYETKKIEKGREGRFKEGEDVKINIAGYVVIVEAPDEEDEEEEEIHLEETVESLRLLPSLGPPVTATTEFVDPEKKRQGSMESSPPAIHSPSPVAHEPHPSSPPAQQTEEIQIYHDELNTPRSSLSPPPANLASPMSRSESVSSNTSDSALLDALLTTLIFAEVKPTSLPRILFDLSHRLPNVAQSQILSVLFRPGQTVTIDTGANAETAVIAAAAARRGPASITITAPLKGAHAAGAQVARQRHHPQRWTHPHPRSRSASRRQRPHPRRAQPVSEGISLRTPLLR